MKTRNGCKIISMCDSKDCDFYTPTDNHSNSCLFECQATGECLDIRANLEAKTDSLKNVQDMYDMELDCEV